MEDKIFLLGVGAQKCGTSWLHEMLKTSNQANMGFAKEYHIFDALTLPELSHFKDRTLQSFRRQNAIGNPPSQTSKLYRRRQFLKDPKRYFRYFRRLLEGNGIRLTGDITPSYSGLSAETLDMIQTGMNDLGVRTKTIFIMRDPVERIWSAVRMGRRDASLKNPTIDLGDDESTQLKESLRKPGFNIRGNYAKTLNNLEKSFSPQNVSISLYEEFFTQDSLSSICDFLCLDPFEMDVSRMVNSSPKTAQISEDIAKEIALHSADSYHAAVAQFGKEKIQSLWWSSKFVI